MKKYGSDLVERARQNKLDPVIGRDDEIRNVIRILSRKSKNNPVLIGEPGVGKTAIAEGLAQRIVKGDVPNSLKDKTIFALDDEHRALVLALENREALGLDGIVLRWQEEILGFTLGALLTENVFDVHFERARGDIQGAYPAVNRSFARYIREKYPQVRYLDREDDMGLPGLRKAKESYYPDYLEVNFSAVEIRCDLTSRPKTEG